MAVRIVTDSTADITQEQAQALGISVVPLTVFFGEEAFLDGIDLDTASFYARLQSSKELPRTSQPSPGVFQEAYMRLIEEGAEGILSVHLSSKLSGTYQSACTARDTLPDDVKKIPIEVIDSNSVSAGMGMPVLQAAQAARDGRTLEEIKERLVSQVGRARILAVLDTLEYVKRGGRIGGARAMLGNMLSVKPIIALKDGAVVAVEQPRTRSKAYLRVSQLASEMQPIEAIAIVEANEEVGKQLADALKAIYPQEVSRYKLGAVLGTHTGPGTVGIALITANS